MTETRSCQNCKQDFVIEPEDFDFYRKIDVPPPTWCPECRMIRRFVWRNERTFYKRTCALCKKDVVSKYGPESGMIVYCQSCWWSDKWDASTYGREYDFRKPLFEQFNELHKLVPVPALWGFNNVNSDYANHSGNSKSIYLSSSVVYSEDILYSTSVDWSRSCVDSDLIAESEWCYENSHSTKNNRTSFLLKSKGCIDSWFLSDCANCQNCFMSRNLRNKKYVFRNEQCTKEEYKRRMIAIDFGSYEKLSPLREEFASLVEGSLHKFANILKSENVVGEDIYESKNVRNSFKVSGCENIKHSFRMIRSKDAYDIAGVVNCELLYESVTAAENNYSCKFYYQSMESKNLNYAANVLSSSDLFACIGLRNKQYCILNKQYSKEEYNKLVPKIIEHVNTMPYVDKKGRVYKYGEFFPPELSPSAYNETTAQEYFPLTKEEAISQGYWWKDSEERDYKIQISSDKLPDHIKDVTDDIINKVIECVHQGKCNDQCTRAFKIVPDELQFYKKMNLPLPRLCPNCRHYQRLKQRNPLKLWHRTCQCAGDKSENGIYSNNTKHFHENGHCPNEFETPYSPDRKEIVYCESCYNNEVV